MKPVHQSITNIPQGDCLPACIASILEVPLESVPNFCAEKPHEHWFARLSVWLQGQGMASVYSKIDPLVCGLMGWCILGVETKRTRSAEDFWTHAVVGWAGPKKGPERIQPGVEFKVVHDPHPNPSPIQNIYDVIWIVRNAAK